MSRKRSEVNPSNFYCKDNPIYSFGLPDIKLPKQFNSFYSQIDENSKQNDRSDFEDDKIVEQYSKTKNKRRKSQRDEHNSIMTNSKPKFNKHSNKKSKSNTDRKSNKRRRLKDDDSDSSFNIPEKRKQHKNDDDGIINIDVKPSTDKSKEGEEDEEEDSFENAVTKHYSLRNRKNRENEGEVFIKYDIYTITIRELRLLKNDWLNDALIDFFFYYFHKTCPLADKFKNKIFIFSCYSSKYLFEKEDYEKLKKWFKEKEIYNFDILVFPIILKSHWSLEIVFNCKDLMTAYTSCDYLNANSRIFDDDDEIKVPIFLYMDSLGLDKSEFISGRISQFLCEACKKKDNKHDNKDMKEKLSKPFVYDAKIKHQDNWKDCGVFIISYFRHFLESPPSYPYTNNSIQKWVEDFNNNIETKEQRSNLRKILFEIYNKDHPGDEITDNVYNGDDPIEMYLSDDDNNNNKKDNSDDDDEIEIINNEDNYINKKVENKENKNDSNRKIEDCIDGKESKTDIIDDNESDEKIEDEEVNEDNNPIDDEVEVVDNNNNHSNDNNLSQIPIPLSPDSFSQQTHTSISPSPPLSPTKSPPEEDSVIECDNDNNEVKKITKHTTKSNSRKHGLNSFFICNLDV